MTQLRLSRCRSWPKGHAGRPLGRMRLDAAAAFAVMLGKFLAECPVRNETHYLNRLSSPPRKRGSRACAWHEQGASVRAHAPLGSRFAGMTRNRLKYSTHMVWALSAIEFFQISPRSRRLVWRLRPMMTWSCSTTPSGAAAFLMSWVTACRPWTGSGRPRDGCAPGSAPRRPIRAPA